MMAQSSFLNPFIPFVVQIQNGLKQGTLISVQGTSFPSSNRICLNLQVGPNIAPRDSVALHVALDFTRNLIIRNSIHGPNWGVEESHGPSVALTRGQPFKLDILCDAYEYKIAFNGSHFGETKHRIPFQSVFYLAVDGEAQLHSIKINSGGPTMPMPGKISMPNYPSAEHMPMLRDLGSVPPYTPGYNTYYPEQSHNLIYLNKKARKAQRKQAKKTLKYGSIVTGGDNVGVGGYAIHKSLKHKGYKHKKRSKSFKSHCGIRKLNTMLHYKKKAARIQHKQAKNTLKYGVLEAGVGVGAYTVLNLGSSSE